VDRVAIGLAALAESAMSVRLLACSLLSSALSTLRVGLERPPIKVDRLVNFWTFCWLSLPRSCNRAANSPLAAEGKNRSFALLLSGPTRVHAWSWTCSYSALSSADPLFSSLAAVRSTLHYKPGDFATFAPRNITLSESCRIPTTGRSFLAPSATIRPAW
jgi:hypothetical protein